jgi:hypothetical protein
MKSPARRTEPWLRGGLALALLAGTLSTIAAPADLAERNAGLDLSQRHVVPLRPYTAVYRTRASGLSMTLERELRRDQNGLFRLSTEGRLLVVGLSEVAVFDVSGTRVEPHSYIYQGSGLINRRREVHFDADTNQVRSLYKDQWYEFERRPGTLDRLSQQEQFRLWLLNDPAPRHAFNLEVADRRGIKTYGFEYAGDERLQTPMGEVNTLHFVRADSDSSRRSELWLAPTWDYLIVRTVHEEKGKLAEADLLSASLDGSPLSAPTEP